MDDGSTKFGSGGGGGGGSAGGKNGGKEDPKGKKGFVDIVKDGVKIKLDQAIEDAKGGDIGRPWNWEALGEVKGGFRTKKGQGREC